MGGLGRVGGDDAHDYGSAQRARRHGWRPDNDVILAKPGIRIQRARRKKGDHHGDSDQRSDYAGRGG